jgi:hypothetical protein
MVKRSAISTIAALVLAAPCGVPVALAQEGTQAAPAGGKWSFALTPYAYLLVDDEHDGFV